MFVHLASAVLRSLNPAESERFRRALKTIWIKHKNPFYGAIIILVFSSNVLRNDMYIIDGSNGRAISLSVLPLHQKDLLLVFWLGLRRSEDQAHSNWNDPPRSAADPGSYQANVTFLSLALPLPAQIGPFLLEISALAPIRYSKSEVEGYDVKYGNTLNTTDTFMYKSLSSN